MRRVMNPDEFRKNVRGELFKILNNNNICENLEKGILNYSISEAEDKKLVKKWDNIYFTQNKPLWHSIPQNQK